MRSWIITEHHVGLSLRISSRWYRGNFRRWWEQGQTGRSNKHHLGVGYAIWTVFNWNKKQRIVIRELRIASQRPRRRRLHPSVTWKIKHIMMGWVGWEDNRLLSSYNSDFPSCLLGKSRIIYQTGGFISCMFKANQHNTVHAIYIRVLRRRHG